MISARVTAQLIDIGLFYEDRCSPTLLRQKRIAYRWWEVCDVGT